MTDAREQLIELIDGVLMAYDDPGNVSSDVLADAILAAGWTPPKPVKFGRWYRTVLPDGALWAETSDPQDWYLAHPDPAVTLTWQRITTDETWVEWVDHPTDMAHPAAMDWGD